MLHHLGFLGTVLMLLGYFSLEWARFRRRENRDRSYPRNRLLLRSLTSLILGALAWLLFYWPSSAAGSSVAVMITLPLIFLLFLVLLVDLKAVNRQYRSERKRKHQEFVQEMIQTITEKQEGQDSKQN